MKRIATVTWIKHYNFGTYLQAYALQQIIRNQGYNNDILDDASIVEEGLQNRRFLFFRKWAGGLKALVINRKYNKVKRVSERAYQNFRAKYLKINSEIQPLESLDRLYDIFICGSDQIWCPNLNIYSPYYYLGFTKKKKIAYAPSVGIFYYPEKFIPKVQPLLERFDSLSVREEQARKLLSSFLSKPVYTVLDPTLLLNKEAWKVFIKDRIPTSERYILCYFLTPTSWYLDFVRVFANKMHLPIKVFCTCPDFLEWDGNISAGPEEFLNYIYYSEYFFTDSFHGSIFSILFEKQFYTFKRFDETDDLNQNSRIIHLFSLLGLKDYFIDREDTGKINLLDSINYEEVGRRLNTYRKQSLDYLINALKD